MFPLVTISSVLHVIPVVVVVGELVVVVAHWTFFSLHVTFPLIHSLKCKFSECSSNWDIGNEIKANSERYK